MGPKGVFQANGQKTCNTKTYFESLNFITLLRAGSGMVVLTQYADDMFLHFGFSECRVDGVAVDHFVSVLRGH